MDISLLHYHCKKKSEDCFESVMRSVEFTPLGINPFESIKDIINFEIEQEFGQSILKKFTKDFSPSTEQFTFAQSVIAQYKKELIKKSLNYIRLQTNNK